MNNDQKQLLDAARRASANAYAPYSRFRVGAAVLAGGQVFTGVNVENASYNLGLCAERAALSAAVAAGKTSVQGVAVFCADAKGGDATGCAPCGGCRQWLAELAPTAWVVCGAPDAQARVFAFEDLLPNAFGLSADRG